MDICYIEFESQLIIIKNNQKITITPFLTDEPGNVKIGIEAPKGITIDREEIYHLKREKNKHELITEQSKEDHLQKTQSLFRLLLVIPFKSEKLEETAKKLFNREKILTPKSLHKIAHGEMDTTGWIVTCAIDVLIHETPSALKNILSANELYRLWAKPLLKANSSNSMQLVAKAKILSAELAEKIINYSTLVES